MGRRFAGFSSLRAGLLDACRVRVRRWSTPLAWVTCDAGWPSEGSVILRQDNCAEALHLLTAVSEHTLQWMWLVVRLCPELNRLGSLLTFFFTNIFFSQFFLHVFFLYPFAIDQLRDGVCYCRSGGVADGKQCCFTHLHGIATIMVMARPQAGGTSS